MNEIEKKKALEELSENLWEIKRNTLNAIYDNMIAEEDIKRSLGDIKKDLNDIKKALEDKGHTILSDPSSH